MKLNRGRDAFGRNAKKEEIMNRKWLNGVIFLLFGALILAPFMSVGAQNDAPRSNQVSQEVVDTVVADETVIPPTPTATSRAPSCQAGATSQQCQDWIHLQPWGKNVSDFDSCIAAGGSSGTCCHAYPDGDQCTADDTPTATPNTPTVTATPVTLTATPNTPTVTATPVTLTATPTRIPAGPACFHINLEVWGGKSLPGTYSLYLLNGVKLLEWFSFGGENGSFEGCTTLMRATWALVIYKPLVGNHIPLYNHNHGPDVPYNWVAPGETHAIDVGFTPPVTWQEGWTEMLYAAMDNMLANQN